MPQGKSMENLAPVGSWDALLRADAGGADAVYLGYKLFSARAGAANFDREMLREAIRYAHLREMRVHVTLNTLIKDNELEAVREELALLRELKADAVLVQDLGVLRICQREFPELTVHASTQMAIHNATGVRWCGRQGIARVVLARECTLAEIRRCCRENVEIEVFVHGAQCVSASGLCLFSSMAGDRSGNRGRCAQPCRMTYLYEGRKGAWLSPRDLCLRNDLEALREAGVTSVKLEGRLKRPEYTAVVTSSYRHGLDALDSGMPRAADSREMEGLLQIFNRGGMMRGAAFGTEDAGMIEPERVNHQGLEIGRVEEASGRMARVRLSRTLHDGDGLLIRRDGTDYEMIYAGPDREAGEAGMVRLRPDSRVRAGDLVYRLTDAHQMAWAASLPTRRIPVKGEITAIPGMPLMMRVTDGVVSAKVEGEKVEKARSHAASAEELSRLASRTGDTPFDMTELAVQTEDAFVPVSQMNAIRRAALSQLTDQRISHFEETQTKQAGSAAVRRVPESVQALETEAGRMPWAVVRTDQQAEAVRKDGFRVVWYPEDFRSAALEQLFGQLLPGDWLRLPEVCEEESLALLQSFVDAHRDRLGGVMLGSVGQLGLEWPVPVGMGSSVPLMNREAACFLREEGCRFGVASQELSRKELTSLLQSPFPILVQVYGRTQLMLLRHCPARTALGLEHGHADCSLCDRREAASLRGKVLQDQLGHSFPLLRQRLPEGCRIRLMNERPTDWLDRRNDFLPLIELTTEGEEETGRILAAWRTLSRSGLPATQGHWSRPVE